MIEYAVDCILFFDTDRLFFEMYLDCSMNAHFFSIKKPAKRILLLYLADTVMFLLSCIFAYTCCIFSLGLTTAPIFVALEIFLVLAVVLIVYAATRINNIIWRYAGSREYIYLLIITVLGCVLGFTAAYFFFDNKLPVICYTFCTTLLSGVIVLSRIVYREICLRHGKGTPIHPENKRLLIVGAGSAGSRLTEEIHMNPACRLLPIGFVDDSPEKMHRILHGLPVLGTLDDIAEICQKCSIDMIYLAIPSLSSEKHTKVLAECLKTDCVVQTLPKITQITDTQNLSSSLRSITPEELLGREPVEVADDSILEFVHGKRVLITGGGGSIGSELCRQIAAHAPARLVIVDVYENNAYDIQQELINKYGDSLDLRVYIATVCDYYKIESIFEDEKPEIIIHAAAHKHVPLMETVPDEAVKNNVFGTLNTVMAARKAKVQAMILISTDKAVNPTNIMGTTKRICEMIIQYAASNSPDTRFAAVRFGNVLGSNGSVIPLFKRQIAERREVTVTHPDIIRYFMTISEASQLVLTAGAMAGGGEIFVLDMGESVKIDDLARNMIKLAGLVPDKDVKIRYTGLRPGEKLYEELLMSEEGLHQTPNKKIFIGKSIPMNYTRFRQQLEELHAIVNDPAVTPEAVEEKLMEIVPTFRRAADSDAPALPVENTETDAADSNVSEAKEVLC